MNWTLLMCLLAVFVVPAHADTYDDCILSGMKGVSGDSAARMVAQACRNKVNEGRRVKQASFGSTMEEREYKLQTTGNGIAIERHDNGFYSSRLRNTSTAKTVTYVMLTIKDGDFYDFKPKPLSNYLGLDLDNVLGEVHWQSERQRKYFYKLTLRPGKELRLLFPEPKTAVFYPEITMALGREAKWSDAVATVSASDEVKPEARDPLE